MSDELVEGVQSEKYPFRLEDVFPEPAAIFSFQLKAIAEVKKDCLVVLDTTALLVPYSVSSESLAEIGNTLRSLKKTGRVRVPAQAAREFAVHRATKLAEVYQQLSEKQSRAEAIQFGKYPLMESLEEYQKAVKLEKKINPLIEAYREVLGKATKRVEQWSWNDPVSLLYGDLFTSETIVEPNLERCKLEEDLKHRNERKIPPGYKDDSKDSNSGGDLVTWHSILELGRTRKKNAILVSGDVKSDWFHKSKKRPLYPRFELIDEYRRASEGASFHILRLSEFLLEFGAKRGAVEEVRNEEVSWTAIVSDSDEFPPYLAAREAVYTWLRDRFKTGISFYEGGGRSFAAIEQEGGDLIGIEVKTATGITLKGFTDSIRDFRNRVMHDHAHVGCSQWMMVVVFPDRGNAAMAFHDLRRVIREIRPLTVTVGYLKAGNRFFEVGEVSS